MARGPYCSAALASGVCAREGTGCPSKHDIRHCDVCDVYLIPNNWGTHVSGRRHKNSAQYAPIIVPGPDEQFQAQTINPLPTVSPATSHGKRSVRCDACGIFLLSPAAFDAHKNSRRHKAAYAKFLISPASDHSPPSTNTSSDDYIQCSYCNMRVEAHHMKKHEKENRHIGHSKDAAGLDEVLDTARKNKHGVVVSEENGVDLGIISTDFQLQYEVAPHTITVEKAERSGRIALKSFSILPQIGSLDHEISFVVSLKGTSRWINFGSPLFVAITLKPSCVGRHEALLALTFHDLGTKYEFTVVRELRAIVGSPEDHKTLLPSAPYSRPAPIQPATADSIHPGKRPVVWTKVKYKTRLPQYKVPSELVDVVFGKDRATSIAGIREAVMPGKLTMKTYCRFFQVCLHIEEEYQRRELAQRSLLSRTLQPGNQYYMLKVPEAGDPRFKPKVVVGDTMLFQHIDSSDKTWYQGVIHEIDKKTNFKLRFDSAFSTYRGKKFDVQFVLNRVPFRRAHQAITNSFSLRRLLFPGINDKKLATVSGEEFSFFERRVGNNFAQRDVVETVLAMEPGCSPLVIYGPPGTGKTSTVVESIKQLIHRDPRSRILACAPSNMAADVIAYRLKTSGTTSLLRLCAFSREVDDVMEELKDVIIINESDVFAFPPLEQLEKYQVIVCTCVTGGILSNIGLIRGHFNFIFIDEAGQASEPIAIIPIKSMADNYTNVVLSGDKDQLGPSVRSSVANRLGLGKSYMERLMESSENDSASGVITKKLREHYRSHEAIISFPNQEFYGNELIPRGDPAVTHSLLRRDILVNSDFPIVFHGVAGKDEREGQNPSFFNAEEASLVKQYVSRLMEDKKLRLEEHHIGIISPYNAQCAKISNLVKKNWPKIKVGNVEDYQGQERRVIIISTVRSSLKQVQNDLRYNLGFVADRRRFNVAVTRAQALLIIIGDPVTLSIDPLWRRFLDYIHLHGGWSPKGKRRDWEPSEDATAQRFADERRERTRDAVQRFIERTASRLVDSLDVFAGAGNNGDDEILETFMDKPWGVEIE
ncbi:hypothetical protein M0805_002198 [Coniferiporia weirii]|nr:hypothetical protein M0805_002198 [Coniferiporia weirii]